MNNEALRTAQLILYTELLFRTPAIISDSLNKNEIALFYSDAEDLWCVCNKWDFSVITTDSSLEFIDIKPARGSGRIEMRINSLTINDKRENNELLNLSNRIEEITKFKVKRTVGYDD